MVRDSATRAIALGPTPLDVPEENVRIVYAVGGVASGSFTVLVQDYPLDD